MSAIRIVPVASVLTSSATAAFPPASLSPMMPEPTTAASRNAVPMNSAINLLLRFTTVSLLPFLSLRLLEERFQDHERPVGDLGLRPGFPRRTPPDRADPLPRFVREIVPALRPGHHDVALAKVGRIEWK